MIDIDYRGHIKTAVTVDIDVALTANDVYNWIQACDNPETLSYISRAAVSRRNRILFRGKYEDDDDFRSRA